jgi:hypothetical protein
MNPWADADPRRAGAGPRPAGALSRYPSPARIPAQALDEVHAPARGASSVTRRISAASGPAVLAGVDNQVILKYTYEARRCTWLVLACSSCSISVPPQK